MRYFSGLFIFLGLTCLVFGGYLVWQRHDPDRLRFKDFEGNYEGVKIVNPPARIFIKNVGIDLPVYPARVSDGSWETTTVGASYLTSSPIPGDVGNSIVYGHNWESLFGNLIDVKPGDSLEVEYQNKSRRVFNVVYTSVVSSDASGVLAASKDKRITLYTCSGWFDEKRFVAVAVLQ